MIGQTINPQPTKGYKPSRMDSWVVTVIKEDVATFLVQAMTKEDATESVLNGEYDFQTDYTEGELHVLSAEIREIEPKGEDRDKMLRGFGYDPDNPSKPNYHP